MMGVFFLLSLMSRSELSPLNHKKNAFVAVLIVGVLYNYENNAQARMTEISNLEMSEIKATENFY